MFFLSALFRIRFVSCSPLSICTYQNVKSFKVSYFRLTKLGEFQSVESLEQDKAAEVLNRNSFEMYNVSLRLTSNRQVGNDRP
jgi:hypothetical protein